MVRRIKIIVALSCFALLVPASPANADVPPSKQAALLLRILAYDRNLNYRPHNKKTIRVVVVDAVGVAESLAVQADMVAALKDITRTTVVAGLSVEILRIPFSTHFEKDVAATGVAAVYLCPGLGDVIDEIVPITRKLSILSFSDSETYVKHGTSVGLLRRGSRATILVNLTNARAEGSDFDPEILSFFEVIR
jgi:hypothetical protein